MISVDCGDETCQMEWQYQSKCLDYMCDPDIRLPCQRRSCDREMVENTNCLIITCKNNNKNVGSNMALIIVLTLLSALLISGLIIVFVYLYKKRNTEAIVENEAIPLVSGWGTSGRYYNLGRLMLHILLNK